MLPGEPAKKNCDFAALFGRKRALHRPVKMCGPVKTGNLAQPHALRFQTLLSSTSFSIWTNFVAIHVS